jgi:predicted enzyme related to lactoylglutathione lyase
LFGWRLNAEGTENRKSLVMTAHGDGIGGVIGRAGDVKPSGVELTVEVDGVFENLNYAEELGGKIIELPHEIMSAGRRVTVASFVDPEGNGVRLSNTSQKLAGG